MEWSYLGVLVMGLCCTLPVVWGQGYDNVARGKSNVIDSGGIGYGSPTSVNDGNSSTRLCMSKNTLTNANAGWQVDLERHYPVYNITIYTYSNLYPFHITVDSLPCVTEISNSSDVRKYTVACSSVIYGQKVRIIRYMTINLCEFEIWVCQAGWYGPDCDQACWSNQCVNNMCHPESGLCLEYEQTCATPNCSECVAGRWGNNCLNTCESNCATGTCVKTAGKCFECKQGFSKHHTATCSPCSAFCNTGDCDKDSGKCIGVCQAGWWGGQCEKSCHENCEPNTCDRFTGDCKGCVPGRYGDQCKFLCQSSNCLKNQCDKTSGLCLSCPTRYFGDLCQVCQAGWWGGQCEKSCHENCEPNTCDRFTGDCKDAQGKTTTQQEVYESNTDKLIVPVVGSIVGVGLLLTISLTAAVCWINRRRRHSKFTDTDDNYYSTPDTVPLLDDTERRLPDLPSSSPSSGNNGNTEPKTIQTDITGNDYTHSKTINTGNIGNNYTHLKTINTGNIGNNYSHLKTINTGNTDDDYTHPKTIQTDNTGNEYTRPKAVRTDNTYENKTQSNTVRTESPDRQGTQPKTSRTQGTSKQDTERTYEGHVYTAIDTDETTF